MRAAERVHLIAASAAARPPRGDSLGCQRYGAVVILGIVPCGLDGNGPMGICRSRLAVVLTFAATVVMNCL